MIFRSVLNVHLLGVPAYHDNETVRALISYKWQRWIFCQRFLCDSQISVSQIRRVKHDVRRKRLDLACAWVEVANVTRKHVSNAQPTWRNVLSRTESFGDFSVDFRHWFALPKLSNSPTRKIFGRIVAVPSASKQTGFQLSGWSRLTMQVKPFALSRTLTKPFRSSTYTPAPLRRCSGAALTANAISFSRGRSSGNDFILEIFARGSAFNSRRTKAVQPSPTRSTKQTFLVNFISSCQTILGRSLTATTAIRRFRTPDFVRASSDQSGVL